MLFLEHMLLRLLCPACSNCLFTLCISVTRMLVADSAERFHLGLCCILVALSSFFHPKLDLDTESIIYIVVVLGSEVRDHWRWGH